MRKGPGFSGCGRTSVKADPLEQFIVKAVLYRLDSPELAAAMSGEPGNPDAERWQAEIDQSRGELEELAAMYGRREIAMTEWQAARAPIERTGDRREEAAWPADPHHRPGRPNRQQHRATRNAGRACRLTRQHAIVAAVIDHITVAPARRGYNRFDPTRFTPLWRA